jgi:RNA polymerase sigma factor (sigma-70 family)
MQEPTTTCWTVIADAAAGDPAGRAAFAERYAAVVNSYLRARWRGGPLLSDVDDASQEVFLECLKERGALERARPGRPGGFRAFLYGVTRNVASRIEERRARRREERMSTSMDQRADGLQEEDLAAAFDRAWATATVREAARRQEERARHLGADALRRVEILHLRFGSGLPVRAIAERLGCEPARIHKEYSQAREEFEESLREVVRFHDPAGDGGIDEECRRLIAHLA